MPQKLCGDGASFAAGGYIGGSAEAGIGAVGAGAQGSYSAMTFGNGEGAVFKTTGAFVGGPGYGVSSPSSRPSTGGVVIGGTIGAGGGLAFSNARKANDLAGNAQTYNVNVGPISLSASFGEGGIFSVNAGLSLGASFAVSTYQTNTTVVYRDTRGCK